MPDEPTPANGIIKQTIDSATALVTAVPIYQDALQPAAIETGKALCTVGKAINVALAPVAALVWGYDKIKDFVQTRVAEKLEGVPEERIQTPNPSVVGPALEALKYNGHEDTLKEMYANLIANSLDHDTAQLAHPAFVDIIKSLSPDEAKILRLFSTQPAHPTIEVRVVSIKEDGYKVLISNMSFMALMQAVLTTI